MAGELVAEAVEEGLPVEEGVGAPDGRPLRRRAPAQDTDQSGLVRAPSCNSAHQRQRPPRQCISASGDAATKGNGQES